MARGVRRPVLVVLRSKEKRWKIKKKNCYVTERGASVLLRENTN